MVTRSDAIRIMHEVKNLCSEILPVKEAYLYGSYARGDFHSESDVDILVTADILPEDVSYQLHPAQAPLSLHEKQHNMCG